MTKFYGVHPAIRGLTFDASAREILGFLGPNGAGKTTTMRILAGFMPPSEGRATVAGFDVVDQSLEVRRRVGYLPETVPLYPDLTVSEYLGYMGSLRRVADLDHRIEAVLEEVALVDRSESFIGNLSKGLRQRVGLAQALLHQPQVLILDEPTIGLDPAQIIEVRRLIQGLGKERTVMLSTHILSEAQSLCDRVLIINKGTIVAEDTPSNLQAQLAGAEQLILRVSAPDAALVQALGRLPGVASVSSQPGNEELRIETRPGNDVRARLARTVVEKGFDLLELRPAGVSLEEVFLQLTQDAAEAEDA
ncbi:MAG TPA: ATP-binding cassette domain-containing protein [Anaerolineales bacterium]|nr:ATP-binding cassette domain-containing protein [Anaerolineales bacterium]